MKMYRTTQLVPVSAGTVVLLSEAQARDRKGRVEELGEGRYRLKELLVFKKGEVLGIEGALPKVHQELVEAVAEAGVDASADLMAMAAKPIHGRHSGKKG